MLDRPPVPLQVLRWLLRVGAVVALVSLVVEYGFAVDQYLTLLHGVDVGVAALFATYVFAKFFYASDRLKHLRSSWIEVVLMSLLAAEILGVLLIARESMSTRFFVIGAQGYLLASMVLGLVRYNERLTRFFDRPALLLLGSFVALIGLGTFLLSLPRARSEGTEPWTFMDAFFTATSAACVTGLNVRDVGADLSFRGQAVVLIKILLNFLHPFRCHFGGAVFDHEGQRHRLLAPADDNWHAVVP